MNNKILIIADDPTMQGWLAQALSGDGLHPFVAPGGGSALFQMGLVQPDLIVIAIPRQGKDRWRTLLRIRELSLIPVIALIAAEDREARCESLNRGADSCLSTPLEAAELRARARSLLRRVQYATRSPQQPQPVPSYSSPAP